MASASIVENFTTRVLRGDRLGIVGANGAGKTTLVNLLTGALAPDCGKVRFGANLEMATLDQSRASLDPGTHLAGRADRRRLRLRRDQRRAASCRRLHEGLSVQARTGAHADRQALGRRARAPACSRARWRSRRTFSCSTSRPTISISKRSICCEEMLADYPGTLIVVSHDRDFLDRVATCVLIERRRRPLDRICRRLFRHGRAARHGRRDAGARAAARAETKEKPAPREKRGDKPKLSFKEQHALATLPGKIDELRRTSARSCSDCSTTRSSMRAIRRNSRRRAKHSPCCKPTSPRPKMSGSRWKSSARNRAVKLEDFRSTAAQWKSSMRVLPLVIDVIKTA